MAKHKKHGKAADAAEVVGEAAVAAATASAASGANAAAAADALSPEFFEARKADLAHRVGKKRFAHVLGVVETADQLARVYGVDVQKARLGALLHDWDKAYKDDEIRQRARSLGVAGVVHPDMMDGMPQLLHGPTAAAALALEFPQIPRDVLRAISLHTTGDIGMTSLDMLVYVADLLEPSRHYDGLDELRALVGEATLEELFLASFSHVMQMLVRRQKLLYTPTINVWNHYVCRLRTAE